MNNYPSSLVIGELHDDLTKKYETHVASVETAWRSFDENRRANCIKAGAVNRAVLKHSLDTSLGEAYKITPEWNLADLTQPSSNFLLDILKHRSTKSLYDQYSEGVNGTAGDSEFVQRMTRGKSPRRDSLCNCYTLFIPDRYGESIEISPEHVRDVMANFTTLVQRGLLIPQSLGELVLKRQTALLQYCKVAIENILCEGSVTGEESQSSKQFKSPAKEQTVKLTLAEVIASAEDRKSSFEEYLSLLRTESTVLCPTVNAQLYRHPGLLPDEEGRFLPFYEDKCIGAAIFETIHQGIQGIAIWESITGLLNLLQNPSLDKLYKATILQELSNMCHFEYTRTQTIYKQQISTGMGFKWFKRLSKVFADADNATIVLKGDPIKLTRKDPHLHYLLRLCQHKNNALEAVEWMEKLSDLYTAHPLEREKLFERENRTICDMTALIAFLQDLSSVFLLPSPSWGKGHLFISRLQDIRIELHQLKKGVDQRTLVPSIIGLLAPQKAESALEAIDKYVDEKTGTKMGFLYQDEVKKMFQDLQEQYRQTKDKLDSDGEAVFTFVDNAPYDPAELVKSRREKEKTRPPHSSVYVITPVPADIIEKEHTPSPEMLKVSPTTAGIFSTLFDRSQPRRSVSWKAFEAAMAELGFSVLPRFGSVYTFRPPESAPIKTPICLHRPHKSQIEGHLILVLARRLNRAYGWSESSFEAV
ncbi:hypothetical protein FSARC_12500 [Fusarium sarcochroum]|uniref:Ipa protein n=1 Tax=Fusarium sarcochroum TaxID=1208366 RepID=A0A8H4T806_9HYPO|nr:hypothetical protein FSARC_12500 [Fusarium sarcochroum]